MRSITSVLSRPSSVSNLKSILFSLIFLSLLFGVFVAGPAWAVHDILNANNIELDGNTVNDGLAVDGLDDWDDVYADCGTSGACAPLTTSALRQALVDDSAASDTTTFKQGLKDTHPISDWSCTEAGVQGKSDIQFAYAATYQDNGDVYLYAGADRDTVEGSANFGIWLFQEEVGCVSAGGVTPFTGQHLDGDMFLVAEFDQGGSVSTINVYRWSDPDLVPENGDECLGGGAGDCSDEGDTFLTGLNCSNSLPGDVVCGITNDLAVADTAWRAGIGLNGFYEAGANLTDLIGDLGCFANVMIETRSSTSLTASIKDFSFMNLSTCGSLTVTKETIGGSGTFGFSVDPTAGGPDAFDLMGGDSQVFPVVDPDLYTIAEGTMPAGPAAPNGWNLTDISCVNGTPGATVINNGGHDGGSIEMDIGFNDDVECTFTNTFTAPPGTITVAKICDSTTAGAETFDYTLVGFGGSSTADCADGSVTLACGESVTCEELVAGNYTVDETSAHAEWNLTDVTCSGGTSTCGPGETPDASIALGEEDDASATFTNTENATIEICKETLPAAVGGDFAFTGDLGAFALADGACTEPDSVVPDTAYDVTETAKAGFTLTNINCSGANWTSVGAAVTVTPEPGEAVSCTYTNTQNPGFIQVCKNTVTNSAANPAFEFDLTGPDGDLPASTSLQNGECDFGSGDANQVLLTVGSGYAVSEDAVVGWDTTISCVGSDGAENEANIDISADETVVCTFTNTQRASLTLVKTVTNDHGGLAAPIDWTLAAAGPTPLSGVSGNAAVTNVLVLAGGYTLSESGGPLNYSAGSWGCSAGSLVGAIVTLAAGDVATCTINNNDDPAGLTLQKVVVNDNGGTAAKTEWTLSATGPVVISGNDGDASITGAVVSAGVYTLAESGGPSGYTEGSWSCSGGNLSGDQLTLGLGEGASCSITNDDIPPPPLEVPIPTSNTWALILLTLMLLATGWYFRPAAMRKF